LLERGNNLTIFLVFSEFAGKGSRQDLGNQIPFDWQWENVTRKKKEKAPFQAESPRPVGVHKEDLLRSERFFILQNLSKVYTCEIRNKHRAQKNLFTKL